MCSGNIVLGLACSQPVQAGHDQRELSQTPAKELCAAKCQDSWHSLPKCACQRPGITLPDEPERKTEGGSGLCPFRLGFPLSTPVTVLRYKAEDKESQPQTDIPSGQALVQMLLARPVILLYFPSICGEFIYFYFMGMRVLCLVCAPCM